MRGAESASARVTVVSAGGHCVEAVAAFVPAAFDYLAGGRSGWSGRVGEGRERGRREREMSARRSYKQKGDDG